MEQETREERIHVTRSPGWPIVLQQSLVFSVLDDAEFRIACAYLSRDGENEEAFEDLMAQYDSGLVADVISWVHAEGITANG
jgi:hypothetical protein